MTSPSRKSRRITAWATTRKAAWISLLMVLSGPALFGQGQPAPTTWQPYQPPTAPVTPPIQPVIVPNLPALPSVVAPPKMATFQKPADDVNTLPLPVVPPQAIQQPTPLPPLPQTPPMPQQRPVTARPAVFQKPAPPAPAPPVPAPAPPTPYPAPPATYTPPMTPDTSKLSSTTGKVPSKAELFRLDSDAVLDKRILVELDKKNEIIPPIPPLVPPGTKYQAKTLNYPPSLLLLSPNFVVHRKLYFEEKNAERAGWDLGPAQSLLSAAYFMKDAVLLPAHIASGIHDCYDASPGKGMPGAPTPYYYYPPGITPFGYAVELAAITGLVFIIP